MTNLLVFSSWYLLLYNKRSVLRFSDRLTGTFILGLTQIIATGIFLGAGLKELYPAPLFILNILISSCAVTAAAMNSGTKGALQELRDKSVHLADILKGDLLLLSIFVLFAISVCRMIFLGYLFPSYSWDALYYHLPIVGQILQSGSIQEHANPSFIQQYINIFPKNINLFFLWNIIFLKNDAIVDLSQLFFTLAGVTAIYSAAVKLSTRESHALYAALLFFFTPVLILQSTVNYVDAAVSALFLIAINFLIFEEGADLNSKKLTLLLAGLSAGILLGSKPTAPLFIVTIFAALLLRGSIRAVKPVYKGQPAKTEGGIYLTCFILPLILTGAYWYLRNWVLHGNPVYYMDVSLFGVQLFDGLKSDWVEPSPDIISRLGYAGSLFYVWLERVGYYMYDSRLSGFGPIWYILFLPAIVFSFVYSIRKKRFDFLFVISLIIAAFLLHPRNWTTRYVIFAVGAGALSFGLVLDYFEKRGGALKVIALLLAAYTFLTVNSPCIMPEKISEFIALPADKRTLSRHKPFNIDVKVRDDYGYWIWIENNLAGGDTLVYTFEKFDLNTQEPFFTAKLWNREFSNKVFYVKAKSYNEWLEALAKAGASYILIKNGSVEDKWIEKERRVFYAYRWMGNVTEKFRIVYSDPRYRIVRFSSS